MEHAVLPDPATALIERLCAELAAIEPNADVASLVMLGRQYLPTMFGTDNIAAHDAAYRFFILARDLSGASFPATWFGLFRLAFDDGLIGAITWGAAARMIYTGFGPSNGYAGEHHQEFLDGFRVADPAGMMMRQELRPFCFLPKTVTIYRGAVAADAAQAAQGISWSLSRHYAAIHVFRRKLNNELLETHIAARPRLVTATVPLDAVFAYLSVPGDEEVLVDYELIDCTTLRELAMPSDVAVLANGVMLGKAGKGGIGNSFGMNLQ